MLRQLSLLSGVSGYEDEVRAFIAEHMKPYVDEMYVDKLGNLICHKKGKGQKVMVCAHMDEVGFYVVGFDGPWIKFEMVTGRAIDERIMLGRIVRIHGKKAIDGVITSKPVHVLTAEERKEVPDITHFYIDVGAKNEKEVEKYVSVGDPISFYPLALEHSVGKRRYVIGKALDDRVGCFVLLELAKRLKRTNKDVYFVFTAQEEVGAKGAKVAAYQIDPDYAIAVDVTFDQSLPFFKEKNVKMGKGPSIILVETGGLGLITHPILKEFAFKVAKQYKVPYQKEVTRKGMTDASMIYLTKEGIPSISIGVPTRNIHTPSEIVLMDDIQNTVRLVEGLIKEKVKL